MKIAKCKRKICRNDVYFPRMFCSSKCWAKYRSEKYQANSNKTIIADYIELKTLAKVGKKYNITRERVRQILVAKNFNVQEYKKFKRLERKVKEHIEKEKLLKTCSVCERRYRLTKNATETRLKNYYLCMTCYRKVRNKVYGYKNQQAYMQRLKIKDPKRYKKYTTTTSRNYYRRNKEHISEYNKQWLVKNNLKNE